MFWVVIVFLLLEGYVNVFFKGGFYFGIFDIKIFWYFDFSGFGNEIIFYLYEKNNGWIIVMFNVFEGLLCIVCLFGYGIVFENGIDFFNIFVKKYEVRFFFGVRSIIFVYVY